MKVLDAPADAEYIALSYVWEQVQQLSWPKSLPEQMETVVVVPSTISDAAKLTLRLGKQFLWVDRLCIDHQNHEQSVSRLP